MHEEDIEEECPYMDEPNFKEWRLDERALTYSDVHLIPNYSYVDSRRNVDTSVKFGPNHKFRLPVIPANMRAVIDEDLARWFSANDYMYIMHRFDVDILEFVKKANDEDWINISISIGVKEEDYDILTKIASLKLRVDFITIDVAHGHCNLMHRMIDHVKRCLPDTYLIAGNVATGQAADALVRWGADCVKAGIGQGHVCTTKDKTGFTCPMFTCVEKCCIPGRDSADRVVIADGGIRCNGDIAKALVAGAQMVMIGSQFSACLDSPAETVRRDGGIYKRYFGSASIYNKRTKRHIEGIMKEIVCNQMTYAEKLQEIEQDLQSACTYAGGDNVRGYLKPGVGIEIRQR